METKEKNSPMKYIVLFILASYFVGGVITSMNLVGKMPTYNGPYTTDLPITFMIVLGIPSLLSYVLGRLDQKR